MFLEKLLNTETFPGNKFYIKSLTTIFNIFSQNKLLQAECELFFEYEIFTILKVFVPNVFIYNLTLIIESKREISCTRSYRNILRILMMRINFVSSFVYEHQYLSSLYCICRIDYTSEGKDHSVTSLINWSPCNV